MKDNPLLSLLVSVVGGAAAGPIIAWVLITAVFVLFWFSVFAGMH